MLKKFLNTLSKLATNRAPINPSVFGDPFAEQVEWTPLKRGGASFFTHRLAKPNLNRIEFRASMGAKLFSGLFILAGVGAAVGFTGSQVANGTFSQRVETLLPIGIGTLFVAVGGWMFHHFTAPIIFDKHEGFFWKGKKSPTRTYRKTSLKDFTEIDQIHALQLISEYCRGDKNSYYSYELNLVLRDGKRLNVVDHGSQDELRGDAGALSEFLEKPVWDAIQ